MKKIISIVLAVMLVVSVAAVSAGAYNNTDDYSKMSPADVFKPSNSYTVDDNTPTCEEALLACGGNLKDVQYLYFQLPEEDPNQKGSDWVNKFNTDANGVCQVCLYWWGGIGSDWSAVGGGKATWVGFRTTLIDKENRIYRAVVSNDGSTPLVIWDNGVNGGMDKTKEIFNYARQLAEKNIEGAVEGDYDTLPEGTPNEDNMDGCIQIISYDEDRMIISPLTGFPMYDSDWYVYYGNGCYGEYPTTSDHFVSKYANCMNPEHLADPDKYHPLQGDVNRDKNVDIIDVFCIQRYLVQMPQPDGMQFDEKVADVDEDTYISIIDATRIQRYLAGICDINGNKLS